MAKIVTSLLLDDSYCNRQRDESVRGPWGKWGHHECRGRRGTWPTWQGGGWAVSTQQWRQVDVHRMPEDKEDGLGATSRLRQTQSMYHYECQSTVTLMIVIVNSVWPVYLFQENKSCGSKKPFAIVLWCTRCHVGHTYNTSNKYSWFGLKCIYIFNLKFVALTNFFFRNLARLCVQ